MFQQKFDINNNVQLTNDTCFKTLENEMNEKTASYMFQSYLSDNDPTRGKYLDSFNQPCVFQTGNYSGFPNRIDDSSSIRQGKYGGIITHDGTKRTNPIECHVNPPYKGPHTMAINPDAMSRLYSSELTHDKSLPLRERSINRFEPLIPEIKDEVQNPVHYIPTFWVRGGMDTKTVVRNIDYLKSCGLKR